MGAREYREGQICQGLFIVFFFFKFPLEIFATVAKTSAAAALTSGWISGILTNALIT